MTQNMTQNKEPSPKEEDAVDRYGEAGAVEESRGSSDSRDFSQRPPAPGVPRFPVKAFAQMCLGQPSSTLRLESHVVETLVLGSGLNNADADAPSGAGGRTTIGGDDMVSLNSARRDALEATCGFHGTQGWSHVDRGGLAVGGHDGTESPVPWQELVWGWYDARF